MKKLHLNLRHKADLIVLAQEASTSLDTTNIVEYFETLISDDTIYLRDVSRLKDMLPVSISKYELECDEQGLYYTHGDLAISIDWYNSNTVLMMQVADVNTNYIYEKYESIINVDSDLEEYKDRIINDLESIVRRLEKDFK